MYANDAKSMENNKENPQKTIESNMPNPAHDGKGLPESSTAPSPAPQEDVVQEAKSGAVQLEKSMESVSPLPSSAAAEMKKEGAPSVEPDVSKNVSPSTPVSLEATKPGGVSTSGPALESASAQPFSQVTKQPIPAATAPEVTMAAPRAPAKAPKLVMALVVVSLMVGISAIILGFSGKTQSGENFELVAQGQEQAIALENQLSQMQNKLDTVTAENDRLETQLRTMAQQIQVALEKIGQEMSVTRGQISTLDGALTAAVKAMNNQAVVVQERPAKKTAKMAVAQEDPASMPKLKEYLIDQGDTFAALSQRFDVPLQELLKANPSIDPKRLQVGQKIQVPIVQ